MLEGILCERLKVVSEMFPSYIRILSHACSREDSMQLWYNLSFVLVEYIVDLHTGFSLKNGPQDLFKQFLMSTLAPPLLFIIITCHNCN